MRCNFAASFYCALYVTVTTIATRDAISSDPSRAIRPCKGGPSPRAVYTVYTALIYSTGIPATPAECLGEYRQKLGRRFERCQPNEIFISLLSGLKTTHSKCKSCAEMETCTILSVFFFWVQNSSVAFFRLVRGPQRQWLLDLPVTGYDK